MCHTPHQFPPETHPAPSPPHPFSLPLLTALAALAPSAPLPFPTGRWHCRWISGMRRRVAAEVVGAHLPFPTSRRRFGQISGARRQADQARRRVAAGVVGAQHGGGGGRPRWRGRGSPLSGFPLPPSLPCFSPTSCGSFLACSSSLGSSTDAGEVEQGSRAGWSSAVVDGITPGVPLLGGGGALCT
jgi:hypothetical protein